MDRNNIIGFLLLAILIAGYSIYSKQKADELKTEQEAKSEQQAIEQTEQDSIANYEEQVADEAIADTTATASQSDSTTIETTPQQQENLVKLENEKLALTFSSKGGRIVKAVLKEYESYQTHYGEKESDFEPVTLYDEEHSTFNWTANGKQSNSIYFDTEENEQGITFSNGEMSQTYRFSDDNPYLIEYTADFGSATDAELNWNTNFVLQEKDMRSDREFTFFAYRTENGKFKKFRKNKEEASKIVDDRLDYIVQRQRFFSQTLLGDGVFSDTKLTSSYDKDDPVNIKLLETESEVELTNGAVNLQILIAPNERDILRTVDKSLVNIQPKGILGLTKALAWLFDVFRPFFTNYGLLILLMTILIKLVLTPLTYKSYLSQAKMSVLKPEVAELNEKYKDDPAKKSQEQMKLYNKAGVNPLGGCIPSLLQIPIFFSLYYFFRSSIFFRQKEFLWANDLSTYDEVIKLPFTIPIMGDHISLFAVLYGVALFFSMQMTTSLGGMPTAPATSGGKDDGGGMANMMQTQMKFMKYAMPIFLPFIFNSFPAALTFYYFCYNIINAIQTWVIKKFVIDEDKIHAQIQENKKKPSKKSGFRKRLEEAMKAQQEMQKKQGK